MTKALDYFDPASEYGDDLSEAFRRARVPFLVVSFTSDWRFSPERSEEIVRALIVARKDVSYTEIESAQGHDAFLMPNEAYQETLYAYMKRVEVPVA